MTSPVTQPDARCPFCGEDVMIELDPVSRRYVCLVCARTWAPEDYLEPPRCGTVEECGRLSGIPPCCRRWFLAVWQPLVWYETDAAARAVGDGFVRSGWDYIPCPGCRQCGARIHLLDCDCFWRRQWSLPFLEEDSAYDC